VARRFKRVTRQAVLVGLALGALVLAPGPQAARLVDAHLAVSLSGPQDTPVVGQTVSYTATVVNKGPDQATQVSLTATASGTAASITEASSSVGEQCTITKGSRSANCPLGTVGVGSSAQMTLSIAVTKGGTLNLSVRSHERQYNPVAADGLTQLKVHVAETVPPVLDTIFSTEFTRPISPHRSFSVRWRASDTGGSGVATYDVRYREAAATAPFGAYQDWLSATAQHGATFKGAYGTTYCFSFRATDYDGNTSDWSADRCASVQLPPTSFRRTPGWTQSSIDGGMRTQQAGASLSMAGIVARRLVLSALVGPHYGQLAVFWKGRLLRTINLQSSNRAKTMFTLGDFGKLSRGNLLLRVVSDRKTVALSALGVVKL
jgi:Domain of unknown function DUF11